jgi:hypothetical protein
MKYNARRVRLMFGLAIGLSVLVQALAAQQGQTLVLTGRSGDIPVSRIGGRYFVEIEALTRLANGSVSFKGNQIVLTLPLSAADVTAPPDANQAAKSGFSKDFIKAAIEEMSVIREWRSTLANAVQLGYPVTEDWVDPYRALAQQNLLLVNLAASTESDHKAAELITNEFNNMKTLCDRFLNANKSRIYTATNALDNDPLDQKILNCAHSLATMAANNQFTDGGPCR